MHYSNPFGSCPPQQTVDMLLGKSYHIVKAVYLHLKSITVISEYIEELIKVAEVADTIVDDINTLKGLVDKLGPILDISNEIVNISNNIEAINTVAELLESIPNIPETVEKILETGEYVKDFAEGTPRIVESMGDVYNSKTDGYFWVKNFNDPDHGNYPSQIKIPLLRRAVKATGSTEYRILEDRFADVVNVRDFGAKGDSFSDDTEAIRVADAWSAENGRTLYFPSGQYKVTSSITHSATWIGSGAPSLAPFPLTTDDKKFLRLGYKNKLPGTSILFSASGTLESVSTGRQDMFASVNYALRASPTKQVSVNGMAIVMDMNVFDADGALTAVGEDDHYDCDVGYLIQDSSVCDYYDFVVFGYWDKAGICILSKDQGDPDYTKFFGGSTMGYYGLALVGSDGPVDGQGLSGTQAFGFQVFANDHHSRKPHVLKEYQDNGYGHCLFADCFTKEDASVHANGVEIFGGGFRTYSNRPIVLNHISNVHFINVPFEFPSFTDQPDSNGCLFIGTEYTSYIAIVNCRNFNTAYISHNEFSAIVENITIVGDHNYGGFSIGGKGNFATLRNTTLLGNNTPRLEFTSKLDESTRGNFLDKDIPSGAMTVGKAGIRQGNTLTVAEDGSITPTHSFHLVLGNGGTDDELNTIAGTFYVGQILILKQGAQSQKITLKGSGGNIRFSDSQDHVLGFSFASIVLMWDGNFWTELNSSLINRIFRPAVDNTYSLGSGTYRWSQVYAATGTINTSDERVKTNITTPNEALMRAWGKVNFRVFQFKDAVEKKGSEARLHVGVIAQDVQNAFSAQGLNVSKYGLFCHDEWQDEYETIEIVDQEEVLDAEGNILTPAVTHTEQRKVLNAGDRYGIRYEEALALECAYLRNELSKIKIALANKGISLEN